MKPAYLYRQRYTLTAYAILTVIVVYLFGGLLTSNPLRNHETPNTYYRIAEFVYELKNVGFPATLLPNAVQHGGFAFPLFYPPLSYYVASFIAILTGSAYLAGNLAVFLSILFSAYTAFFGFSRIGNYLAALTASVLYVTIPYRFVDSIARGALAECWTFVWFPLVFCGGVMLLRQHYRTGFYLICIATACTVISHALMATYFMSICVALFALACLIGLRFKALGYAILAVICAAGLAAWYVIPQQSLWSSVRASDTEFMWGVLEAVQKHNPSVSQFFFSDPKRWFGPSVDGVFKDGMSFELGYANFALILALTLLIIWRPENEKLSRAEVALKLGTVITWIASIAFLIRSQWFLKFLPESFLLIQFSWRMLGITAFFCCASFVYIAGTIRLPQHYAAAIAMVLIAGSVASVDSSYRIIEYIEKYPEEPLTAEKIVPFGDNGYVEMREYAPIDFVEHEMIALKNQKHAHINAMESTATVITVKERVFEVNASTSATIIMPLLSYPIYKATASDGRELHLSSRNGLLLITGIQPGDTTVTLKRVLHESQVLGLLVSFGTIATLIAVFFIPMWGRRKAEAENTSAYSHLSSR